MEGTWIFDCFSYKINGLGVSVSFAVRNEFQFAIFLFCLTKRAIPISLFHIGIYYLSVITIPIILPIKVIFKETCAEFYSVSHYGEQYLMTLCHNSDRKNLPPLLCPLSRHFPQITHIAEATYLYSLLAGNFLDSP